MNRNYSKMYKKLDENGRLMSSQTIAYIIIAIVILAVYIYATIHREIPSDDPDNTQSIVMRTFVLIFGIVIGLITVMLLSYNKQNIAAWTIVFLSMVPIFVIVYWIFYHHNVIQESSENEE